MADTEDSKSFAARRAGSSPAPGTSVSGRIARRQYTAVMTSADAIARRLATVGDELRKLREELRVADEELAHFRADAADAELRAIVSDSKEAPRAAREAQKSVDAITRQRTHVTNQIERLERSQDELLDELSAARRSEG